MKKLLILVAALAIAFSANAQVRVGIHPGIQVPIGDFSDYVNVGFGGSVSGEYLINNNFGVGLNFGYYYFGGSVEMEGMDYSASIMPLTLNAKYYFLPESIKPYLGADLGLYFCGAKAKVLGVSSSNTDTYFGLAPIVGIQYGLTERIALDVNAKYNLIFDGDPTSTFGFNVGLVFTLGK